MIERRRGSRRRKPTKADLERTIANQHKLIGAMWDVLAPAGRTQLVMSAGSEGTLFEALSATGRIDSQPQTVVARYKQVLFGSQLMDLSTGRTIHGRGNQSVEIQAEDVLSIMEMQRRMRESLDT